MRGFGIGFVAVLAVSFLTACSGDSGHLPDVALQVCTGLGSNSDVDLDDYISSFASMNDVDPTSLKVAVEELCFVDGEYVVTDTKPAPPSTSARSPSSTSGTSAAPTDPLDQMEIAFVGGHSRQEIKARIDRAMSLYGLELTSDSYSRAGSVLVALRKEYGPSEMDILGYMIASYVQGVNLSFPDAAAISVTFLSVGDG